jgi:hypothetical protein
VYFGRDRSRVRIRAATQRPHVILRKKI